MILDEATSNLDPITEKRLLFDLFDTLERKSLLYISHRLVGMEKMDDILVLDNGQIIDRGTHHELMDKRGMYSKMLALQSSVFLPGT